MIPKQDGVKFRDRETRKPKDFPITAKPIGVVVEPTLGIVCWMSNAHQRAVGSAEYNLIRDHYRT
jgi:hypothetical protein